MLWRKSLPAYSLPTIAAFNTQLCVRFWTKLKSLCPSAPFRALTAPFVCFSPTSATSKLQLGTPPEISHFRPEAAAMTSLLNQTTLRPTRRNHSLNTEHLGSATSYSADKTLAPHLHLLFLLLLLCLTGLTAARGCVANPNSQAAAGVTETNSVPNLAITNSTLAEVDAGMPYTATLPTIGGVPDLLILHSAGHLARSAKRLLWKQEIEIDSTLPAACAAQSTAGVGLRAERSVSMRNKFLVISTSKLSPADSFLHTSSDNLTLCRTRTYLRPSSAVGPAKRPTSKRPARLAASFASIRRLHRGVRIAMHCFPPGLTILKPHSCPSGK